MLSVLHPAGYIPAPNSPGATATRGLARAGTPTGAGRIRCARAGGASRETARREVSTEPLKTGRRAVKYFERGGERCERGMCIARNACDALQAVSRPKFLESFGDVDERWFL